MFRAATRDGADALLDGDAPLTSIEREEWTW
jgi:hypothetical protein